MHYISKCISFHDILDAKSNLLLKHVEFEREYREVLSGWAHHSVRQTARFSQLNSIAKIHYMSKCISFHDLLDSALRHVGLEETYGEVRLGEGWVIWGFDYEHNTLFAARFSQLNNSLFYSNFHLVWLNVIFYPKYIWECTAKGSIILAKTSHFMLYWTLRYINFYGWSTLDWKREKQGASGANCGFAGEHNSLFGERLDDLNWIQCSILTLFIDIRSTPSPVTRRAAFEDDSLAIAHIAFEEHYMKCIDPQPKWCLANVSRTTWSFTKQWHSSKSVVERTYGQITINYANLAFESVYKNLIFGQQRTPNELIRVKTSTFTKLRLGAFGKNFTVTHYAIIISTAPPWHNSWTSPSSCDMRSN